MRPLLSIPFGTGLRLVQHGVRHDFFLSLFPPLKRSPQGFVSSLPVSRLQHFESLSCKVFASSPEEFARGPRFTLTRPCLVGFRFVPCRVFRGAP